MIATGTTPRPGQTPGMLGPLPAYLIYWEPEPSAAAVARLTRIERWFRAAHDRQDAGLVTRAQAGSAWPASQGDLRPYRRERWRATLAA